MRKIECRCRKRLRPVFRELTIRGLEILDREWSHRYPEVADDLAKDLAPADQEWIDRISAHITGNLAHDLRESEAVKDGVEEALAVRQRAILAQLKGSFSEDMYSRLAADYARAHAYDRGVLVEISDTTKDLVGGALKRAIESGKTYEEVRYEIAQWFGDLEDYETYRIAATEISNASRYANVATTKQVSEKLGIEITQCIWSPAADACQRCLDRAAESERSQWTADQALAMDMVHPHDRCDWIYRVADVEP